MAGFKLLSLDSELLVFPEKVEALTKISPPLLLFFYKNV